MLLCPSAEARHVCAYERQCEYRAHACAHGLRVEGVRAIAQKSARDVAVVCADVLAKYKHELDGGLSFSGSGVDEKVCRDPGVFDR